MPTTDQSALLRTPAKLYANSQYVGLAKDVFLSVKKPVTEIMEEGLGSKVPIAVLGLGEVWGIVVVLKDVAQGFAYLGFQGSEVGAVTGETGIVYPGNPNGGGVLLPGKFIDGVALKLVPLDASQWWVYFANAVPVAIDPKVAFSQDDEGGVPIGFRAMPPLSGANGETAQWRPSQDVQL